MTVTLALFATLKQKAGWNRKDICLPAGSTVGELLQKLDVDLPMLGLLRIPLYVAVNDEYADSKHRLQDKDEVALFPPVSGGRK